MKTYIYPENLRATVKLWFWNIRDFIIICTGIIIAVPMAMTACYAFLSLRAEDTAIMDYMINAARYFCTTQQEYNWQKGEENGKKEK